MVALCVALLVPGAAHGYDLSKSTNGVMVSRSVEDTNTPTTLTVYYSYKGGNDYAASPDPWAGGSYNLSKTYALSTSWDGMEVPLSPGHRVHLIYLGNPANKRFLVVNEPLTVSVPGTVTVTVPGGVSVSDVPSGTVQTVALDGPEAEVLAALGLAGAFVCFGVGFVVVRGLS